MALVFMFFSIILSAGLLAHVCFCFYKFSFFYTKEKHCLVQSIHI